jgi:hypothetical protein
MRKSLSRARRILNYQGKLIDPLNITPDEMDNIGMQSAVTLSRLQRFWGQCREPYTVAQHCLSMVELFPNDPYLQKWAIGHEVYEALTGMDVPRPLKLSSAYEPYRKAEEQALAVFGRRFGIGEKIPDAIKHADAGLLVMEAEALMPYSPEVNWREASDPVGALYKIGAGEDEVRRDFIEKWVELFGGL